MQLLDIIDIIEAQTGQRPNDWMCGWLKEEIAWTRCRAGAVHIAEVTAKEHSADVRKARSEIGALEKARKIVRQRLYEVESQIEDIGEELCRTTLTTEYNNELSSALAVVNREIRSREWIIEQATGANIIRSLRTTDRDVYEHVDVRLNKKHTLDVLVFSSIVIWGVVTNDTNPKIGRPPKPFDNDAKATPFMRFLLAVTKPLNKSLGITPTSLAERARQILGRRVGGSPKG